MKLDMKACLLGVALIALSQAQGLTPTRLWQCTIPAAAQVTVGSGAVAIQTGRTDWTLRAAKDGHILFRLTGSSGVRLLNGLALATKSGGSIEAWSIRRKRRLSTIPSEPDATVGGIVGGNLFFTDTSGLRRANLRTGEIEQGVQVAHGASSPVVSEERVYINAGGHDIVGVDPKDFSHGWKAYCNCAPGFADRDGVLGTGTISFGIVSIRPDGIIRWQKSGQSTHAGEQFAQFLRQPVAVTDGIVAIGGSMNLQEAKGTRLLGPRLYGLRKETGEIVWQIPIVGWTPIVVDGRIVVIAGHGGPRWSPYLGGVPNDAHIEIREARTGRLLRTGPAVRGRNDDVRLFASGHVFVVRDENRLAAYRL